MDKVKKLAWSGIISFVSARSPRGKKISIALAIHSLDSYYEPVDVQLRKSY